MKDMAGEECVPFGEGEVDWPAILERLGELGYSGTLTHEPHIGRDREGIAAPSRRSTASRTDRATTPAGRGTSHGRPRDIVGG